MSVKITFKCDACGKDFTPRDDKGEPRIVGGIKGLSKDDKGLSNLDIDLCEDCFSKIVKCYEEIKK